jgi:hypothetical protein
VGSSGCLQSVNASLFSLAAISAGSTSCKPLLTHLFASILASCLLVPSLGSCSASGLAPYTELTSTSALVSLSLSIILAALISC